MKIYYQVLLVTGGRNIKSTEVFSPGQSKWMEISDLPLALEGIGGATLGNIVYMFGKNHNV